MIFRKKRYPDGLREIYFFGRKILSYKHKTSTCQENKNNISPLFAEKGYDVSQNGDTIKISGKDIILECKSTGSLHAAQTVLCCQEYNFTINRPFVMFDIGLNLGFTSLFMAKNKLCSQIYGYEPFLPTFQQAERNLLLNPNLSQKIQIFNFGLGKEKKTSQIVYNPNKPGSMSSVKNLFEDKAQNNKTFTDENIKIEKVSEIFEPLFKCHNEAIFLKIDCEGAEWEILPELASSNLLKKIDVIVMEWHFDSPEPLIDLLLKENFKVFWNTDLNGQTGMIRAVK